MTTAKRKKIDWEAVEIDYCAGELSNCALARKYGCSDTAIRKKAKEKGWVRGEPEREPSDDELAEVMAINDSHALNPQQARFVLEYMTDLNATQAARRAGYSDKNASSIGYQLLQKTPVQKAIQEQMNARARRTLITADRVIAEVAKLAFSNTQDLYQDNGELIPVKDLPADVAATISEIRHRVIGGTKGDSEPITELSYKTADKKAALELLGKHMKLWVDRVEVATNYEEDLEELAKGL